MFALQQPGIVAFQRLKRIPVVMPLAREFRAGSLWGHMHLIDNIWLWQFELDLQRPTYGYELNHIQKDQVWVLRLLEAQGQRLASPSELVTFEDFVRDLPLFRSGGGDRTRGGG